MADTRALQAGRTSSGAQSVVRRLIVLVILFALVTIGANGLSGLLERLLDAGGVVFAGDDAGLARSLAFALIGVPLAAALWWWQRRKLAEPAERASLVWSLYLAAMSLTALIAATTSVAAVATAGIDGRWEPGGLAAGVVWSGVWAWHRWMRRSALTAPTRLADLTVELSALFGLVVAASGAITALAALVSEALAGVIPLLADSRTWFAPVLQGLVWAAIGAVVWWWHWFREGAGAARGAFALVLLVIVEGAAAATFLFAVGTMLHVLLRAVLDTDPITEVVEPLDAAIAAALVGAVVWVFHARSLSTRPVRVRLAARLVVAAIALIGAASGFGVVINALLAGAEPGLAGDDSRTLLLGGLSALLVGGPVWWATWRPARQATAQEAAETARRVYLVAVFGASAITALVTLLLIGYRIFEVALGAAGGGLVERVRAPFGLLCATVVVFAYHFAVWRRDRRIAAVPTRPHDVGRIVLVAAADPGELAARIRADAGAPVTLWRAADDAEGLRASHAPAVLAALEGVRAPRVLVVAQGEDAVRVIALAD